MSYFENCLYFSGNQLTRHLNKIADDAFKRIDVTPTQGFTLISIDELGKHTPSEIAAELEMTPSTITRFLDKLEKLGYVERTYLSKQTKVDITDSGRRLLIEVEKCWEEIHDRNVEIFGEDLAKRMTVDSINGNKLFSKRYK